MTDLEFDKIFGGVWASKIISYSLDMLRNKISFVLETNDYSVIQTHNLVLDNVTMFYFVSKTHDYEVSDDDWLEFTEINILCTDNRDRKKSAIKINHYIPNANIEIGLWDSFLFVKATAIGLDGIYYKI